MRINIRTFHVKTNTINIVSVFSIHEIIRNPPRKYIQYILEILMYIWVLRFHCSRVYVLAISLWEQEKLDRGCPNGTNTPRGDNFSRYQNLDCDLDLWPFDLKIYRAHPCLMGSLHVKFHDNRCKGKAVMCRKPFSVIYALWPWPLTFWPQNL